MSFTNTKTPVLADITGKAKYQVPMRRGRGNVMTFYLTPELEAHFRRLYPVTFNREMMRMFGISFVTVHRFARQLGLKKNERVIRRKLAKYTKDLCERNGWYDSLRGKAPSEACIAATKRRRAEGFSPIKALRKKNPRKYKRLMATKSEARRNLMMRERVRVEYGLKRLTNLHVPYCPYTKRQVALRHNCKLTGYIVGNKYDEQERWIIYYTADTQRNPVRESNGERAGFTFLPLDYETDTQEQEITEPDNE